ncbi:MAG: MiaB/RimO family radical SAM methylthiotransferase [Deltaproteobacteria bacterium]|nr:MiaB/RimO family radical SAM methylthiotransferase [Deltaproteobacteria bacterium]
MQSYYITYYGCAVNEAEANELAHLMDTGGFVGAIDVNHADLIIILACSVRQDIMDSIYNFIATNKIKKNVLKILTGCVLEYDISKLKGQFDIIIDITKIAKLPKLIARKSKFYEYSPGNNSYLELNYQSNKPWEQLIPISNGCNQFCSYCAVPYTRGRENNSSAKKILTKIKNLAPEVKKITLLGQTVNSYVNPDKNSKIINFADLLENVALLRPDSWVRFASSHPNGFDLYLIKIIAKYPNISRHIHLPLQSGSNKILKLMNRKYTIEQYYELVDKIYKYIPDANLTTDIIVGFPGETKSDFNNTLKAISKCQVSAVETGIYSPRPGTLAQKMYRDSITKAEKLRRAKEINNYINRKFRQKSIKLIGSSQEVLIESIDNGFSLGRTRKYETVKIVGALAKNLGAFVPVRFIKPSEKDLKLNRFVCKMPNHGPNAGFKV